MTFMTHSGSICCIIAIIAGLARGVSPKAFTTRLISECLDDRPRQMIEANQNMSEESCISFADSTQPKELTTATDAMVMEPSMFREFSELILLDPHHRLCRKHNHNHNNEHSYNVSPPIYTIARTCLICRKES